MSEVKRLLAQIKDQAQINIDVDFYNQGDTRSEFRELADLADTAEYALTDEAKVLDQALYMLSICFNQATEISSNKSIYDDLNGKNVSVESVKKFLADNYHVSGDDDANN